MGRKIGRIKTVFVSIILMALILSGIQLPQIANAAAKTLPAPTAVKAVSYSYNSTYISWTGVTGANGYEIYRASSSTGTYKLISTTKVKTYKNTGLTTGQTYYYKIRAYKVSGKTKVYSSYSMKVNAKPNLSSPALIKAALTSNNSIGVSWGSVAGADGYAIYRAASSTGSYTILSTTKACSYEDTELSIGTSYYYKVKAYRIVSSKKIYSDYSSIVSAKPILSVPTSVKTSAPTYNSIKIGWDGVTGASGYEVYKAASSAGIYTLAADIPGTNYSDTNLTASTTYYYKVRAYVTVEGAKVYSDFSSVVSGTTTAINVTGVSLNKSTDTLTVGAADTLTAYITPTNAANQAVTWSSSDSSIATVDSKGNVKAVGVGTAVITVTTVDGGKTASCIVTVNNASDNAPFKGIDVSYHQGTINWAAVKNSGVQFAMLRSSYGDGTSNYKNNGVDSMFETYYAAAKANGIAVGVYHYSYAKTVDKAATEADFLISRLQGKQFEYPVCVDIEDPTNQGSLSKSTLTSIALVYLNKLTEAGYYPMIYCSKSWFTTKLDDTKLTGYDHWLAQYAKAYTYTGTVSMWQYSDAGTVSGINGNVDMDISYVDYAAKIKSLHLNGF